METVIKKSTISLPHLHFELSCVAYDGFICQGMLYNVTRAPPPNGMPMPQGQRGYMPPYQQHPSRPQGPYMTYPQGQTPPPGTQSPIPNMNPLAPMSPGSYPMMPHSPSGGMLPGTMLPPSSNAADIVCNGTVMSMPVLPPGAGIPNYSYSSSSVLQPASVHFQPPSCHPAQYGSVDSGRLSPRRLHWPSQDLITAS